jgi:cytidine deaminase
MTDQELIDAALAVREHAYCPYSAFFVGAALLDDQGQMHIGCNVENASYPQGNCAETSAIGAMVAAGGKKIVTIAVAGGREKVTACTPCGGCRQRIAEFADDQTRILVIDDDSEWHTYTMSELLPARFHL